MAPASVGRLDPLALPAAVEPGAVVAPDETVDPVEAEDPLVGCVAVCPELAPVAADDPLELPELPGGVPSELELQPAASVDPITSATMKDSRFTGSTALELGHSS